MRVFVRSCTSVCVHIFTVVSFRADKLRRGSLHMSAQMIVELRGPRGGQSGGTCEYVRGVFCSCQGDKNSSSHGHIVGTGGNAKPIKHKE